MCRGIPGESSMFSVVIRMWILFVLSFQLCDGFSPYADVTKLFNDKLGSNSGYMTTVRPLLDQSKVIQVNVSFDIVAIVEIDAIAQRFVVNGFVGLYWNDELVTWDPADYSNMTVIHPDPKQIWRPRLILTNTIDARDLFEDDYCPLSVKYSGDTSIHPGSLFPASCKLNLYKYPFDEQNCYIEMFSMGLGISEMTFSSLKGKVGQNYYTKSGEWDIISTELVTYNELPELPNFKMKFKLRRLPGFFIMNIVIPIVLMSFLNILVFIIPVDSGEKISYGITVLLALTVFMSIVSEQLPRSSDILPLVTIYLLVLTVISVCTVIVAIIIVFTHHRGEEETKHQKAASNFKSLLHKINVMNRARKNFSEVKVKPATPDRQFSNSSTTNGDVTSSYHANPKHLQDRDIFNVLNAMKDHNLNDCSAEEPEVAKGGEKGDCGYVNRWRQFGQHLDCIAFIVFTVMWVSVTVGFLVEIAR